jgi:uncharacterized membrane protein YbhN (UPF0104 family)
VIVLVATALGLGVGLFDGPSDALLSWLPAAVGAGAFVGFIALGRFAARIAARLDERPRAAALLRGLDESVRDTLRTLATPTWRLIGPVAYLVLDIGALYVCLRALGVAPPVAPVVLAYQIGYLVNIVPVPGGIGVLDSGLIGMLVLYKVRAVYATGAVLAYHAISLWVPTAIGTVAFLRARAELDQPLVVRAIEPAG